jgi:hypothetical protein
MIIDIIIDMHIDIKIYPVGHCSVCKLYLNKIQILKTTLGHFAY